MEESINDIWSINLNDINDTLATFPWESNLLPQEEIESFPHDFEDIFLELDYLNSNMDFQKYWQTGALKGSNSLNSSLALKKEISCSSLGSLDLLDLHLTDPVEPMKPTMIGEDNESILEHLHYSKTECGRKDHLDQLKLSSNYPLTKSITPAEFSFEWKISEQQSKSLQDTMTKSELSSTSMRDDSIYFSSQYSSHSNNSNSSYTSSDSNPNPCNNNIHVTLKKLPRKRRSCPSRSKIGERIQTLKNQETVMKTKNAELQKEYRELKDEIAELKLVLLAHSDCFSETTKEKK
eukprot:Sdes_comp15204_c0_seq1m4035